MKKNQRYIKLIFSDNIGIFTFDLNYEPVNRYLSYDVAFGSKIMPFNKIDKPLVVYRFSEHVATSLNNVAYIMTKL